MHVVFDDWFTTVDLSKESPDDSIDRSKLTDMFLNKRFSIEFDGNNSIELGDEWLSNLEKAET